MLPDFSAAGDLPEGVHTASLQHVIARFGSGTPERQTATTSLIRIWSLALGTPHLERLIIFGSYVSAKPRPNDVDIILIMNDAFDMRICDEPTKSLFNHQQANRCFGASVFWLRPSMLLTEPLNRFIAYWQVKRDGTRRGIVEVTP